MRSVTSGIGRMARGWRRIAGFAYSRKQPMVGLTTRHEFELCTTCPMAAPNHCGHCGVMRGKHEDYGTN